MIVKQTAMPEPALIRHSYVHAQDRWFTKGPSVGLRNKFDGLGEGFLVRNQISPPMMPVNMWLRMCGVPF